MLTVCTLLWDSNESSLSFSRAYTEEWVEKLYRGFARNLTRPFRFVCFVDRERQFKEPIEQEFLSVSRPSYANCIEPYRLGVPMILVGLDTVVTGNCDALADYCMTAKRLAVPRDPYNPNIVCNGVALVPAGWERVALDHDGRTNDMDWIRAHNPDVIDELFPGAVRSFKVHVKSSGLEKAAIVYFHGDEKPPHIRDRRVMEAWV